MNANSTGETVEDIGFGKLKLIQSAEGFRFGIDAVLLADFARRTAGEVESAVELGSGNGAASFIFSHKEKNCHILGFDVQSAAVEMANRSCRLNNLEENISFKCCDVIDIRENFGELKENFDLVFSNPPYVRRNSGIPGDNDSRNIARCETTAGIEEFIEIAAFLLRERGHLCMVHRPDRLVDIMSSCRKYRLEPKDMQLVVPRLGKRANIVLIHCIKGGGPQLSLHEDLNVRDESGEYSREIMRIYEKTR